MAASATGTVDSKITLTSNNGVEFPNLSAAAAFAPSQRSYTSGVANGNIDVSYSASLSVPNLAPVSIDLSGSLKDLVQANAVFVEVAIVGFYNRATSAANIVTVSGNFMGAMLGTNGGTITLQPGGRFVQDFPVNGIPVTNSTADTITFTSAAGTNDVDVAIGGRSA